jgi:hypothetical protein
LAKAGLPKPISPCYVSLMKFREDLNIKDMTCPPANAAPQKIAVYRLVDSIPMKVEDIWSYRILYPKKVFPDECKARACSVFSVCEEAKNLQKLPNFKRKKIVCINIEEKDGVLLNTPNRSAKSHFSWWISDTFNISSNNIKEAI